MIAKTPTPKARLLIVDDSQDICFLISSHFKFRGFAVETAMSGNEAMKLIEKDHFEIIVCDIIMPGMKGTELLQKVKKQHPMTHVIMITGYVSLEHLLTCMRFGADTCIFKPMDNFSELDTAVEMAIDSMRRWEEKIIALKGLKEVNNQSLEYVDEPDKDIVEIETA
ncbi:MAG: response regulator [Chitinispirillaceae bacterium]|nr:response regulator [Chitinispirillaceae bacterium]